MEIWFDINFDTKRWGLKFEVGSNHVFPQIKRIRLVLGFIRVTLGYTYLGFGVK